MARTPTILTTSTRHIAQVIDAGNDEQLGYTFLVVERLRGENLRDLVSRLGAIRPEAALAIGAQRCLGLQNAHELSNVHRRIKLANIFLAEGDDVKCSPYKHRSGVSAHSD